MNNPLIEIFENYDKDYFVYENNRIRITFLSKEDKKKECARYDTYDKQLLFYDYNLVKLFNKLSAEEENKFHEHMENNYDIEITLIY